MPSFALPRRLFGFVMINVSLVMASHTLPAGAMPNCSNPAPADGHAAARKLGRGLNLGYALEQCLKLPSVSPGRHCADGSNGIASARNTVNAMIDPTGEFWGRKGTVNAESFRLPVAWWHHHESAGHDRIRVKDDYFDLVDRVIRAALKARPDRVIVVNLHEFNKIISNPKKAASEYKRIKQERSSLASPDTAVRTPDDDLIEIWRDIATRLKDYPPGCVYFELLNEPYRENSDKGYINYCNDEKKWRVHSRRLVKTIRATGGYNENRPLVIGTCNPDDYTDVENLISKVILPLRKSIPKLNPLIVTWHYYDPFRATHWRNRCPQFGPADPRREKDDPDPGCIGNQDGREDPYLLKNAPEALQGSEQEAPRVDPHLWKENIANAFATASKFANENSVALYLGEFGYERYLPRQWWPMSLQKVTTLRANRERWICEVVAQAEKHNIAYGFWNYSASFGLSQTDKPKTEEQPLTDEEIERVKNYQHNQKIIDLVLPGENRQFGTAPDCARIDWM